jgi:hypothetical protein
MTKIIYHETKKSSASMESISGGLGGGGGGGGGGGDAPATDCLSIMQRLRECGGGEYRRSCQDATGGGGPALDPRDVAAATAWRREKVRACRVCVRVCAYVSRRGRVFCLCVTAPASRRCARPPWGCSCASTLASTRPTLCACPPARGWRHGRRRQSLARAARQKWWYVARAPEWWWGTGVRDMSRLRRRCVCVGVSVGGARWVRSFRHSLSGFRTWRPADCGSKC